MYNTIEALLNEIQSGEDSYLDFKVVHFKGKQVYFSKEKASQELAKDLCCFANSEGGVIVFGVRDDGERIGIDRDKISSLQQFIVNVAQNNIEPPMGHLLIVDRILIPDSTGKEKYCLKLEIKKARYCLHAPFGKRPYFRIADHCYEMTLEQQARYFEKRGMLTPFEERPVYQAKKNVIDKTLFTSYYEKFYEIDLDDVEVPFDNLLQNMKILTQDEAGALYSTGMGLLLFSNNPDKWISGAYVDIVHYRSIEPDIDNQVDTKTISGNIISQIEKSMSFLELSPYLPMRAQKDGHGRIDQPAYSLRSLQEAIVNALVHRDYSIQGAQVRIFIFPDRIEISNPGKLHNSLTPEALFAGCQPVRRNQMLAGFIRNYKSPITKRSYMEGKGTGFLSMVRECVKVTGRKPDLNIIGDSVRVTIWSRHPFS
ncbi:MAG: putative DNA binding domain-containing protein [Candidatus Magnetomorum sp.]|nr:putative DNA binding domain-containing protein [Candidatus Magnetomorum sp.]